MTLTKSNSEHTKTNNRLSVQVTLTGLSFLVADTSTGEEIFYTEKKYPTPVTPEEIQTDIQAIFSETDELKENFKDVVIIYATDVYTLVPRSLFEETKASEYLKFNSKILTNDFVAHDTIEGHDVVVVYVPYMNVNNYMFDRFGSFKYFHSLSVLLKTWLTSEKYSEKPRAYVHVLENTFDLVIVRDGKLALANTYNYRTPEDFIYYILFSFEQLKLNPDTLEVQVYGNIQREDDLFEILYRYVRNVDLISERSKRSQFLHKNLS